MSHYPNSFDIMLQLGWILFYFECFLTCYGEALQRLSTFHTHLNATLRIGFSCHAILLSMKPDLC